MSSSLQITLYVHILGGAVGLLAGAVAVYALKGARLHRKSGIVFVFAMLTMALTGALVAAVTSVETSVVAGLLTAYLVTTALTTVRPPTEFIRRVNIAAAVLALSVFAGSYAIGVPLVAQGVMEQDGMPVPVLLIFGAIAFFGAVSDIRVLRAAEPIAGVRRLARHLWRMCFALFIASASFFLGQSDKFPEKLRIYPLLIVLALAPLAFLAYWMVKVRVRKKTTGMEFAATHPGAVASES